MVASEVRWHKPKDGLLFRDPYRPFFGDCAIGFLTFGLEGFHCFFLQVRRSCDSI